MSQYRLHLSDPVFCCTWWLVLLFHGVNALFLFGSTVLYWYLTKPPIEYLLSIIGLLRRSLLHVTAVLFAFFAMLHVRAIILQINASIRSGFLSFGNDGLGETKTIKTTKVQPQQPPGPVEPQRLSPGGLWNALFSRQGLLGAESSHFELVFSIREVMEIGLQTYQLYTMSLYVATDWINRLCVAIMVINCVSTPFIQHGLRLIGLGRGPLGRRHALERVLCLLSDIALDFCCSVVIPFAIFLPYAQLFNTTYYGFDIEYIYDPVWYANAVHEAQQIFIISGLDFVSTLAPHMSIVFTLSTAKKFIYRSKTRSSEPTTSTTPTLLEQQRTKWLHVLTCCWGIGILATHLRFLRPDTMTAGCLLHVNAWFTHKIPCSVQIINCHRRNITGTQEELTEAIEELDPSTLMTLALANCPAVSVPPVIQNLPKLYGFELSNSTIVKWTNESMLSGKFHPQLSYLLAVDVNFTNPDGQLPIGMRSSDLPPTLSGVEMFYTNLRELPEDLHTVWPAVKLLFLESSALTELPPVLLQMPWIQYLSLIGNGITSIPEVFLEVPEHRLTSFYMNANPLTSLPSTIHPTTMANLMEFTVEFTAIDAIPVWIEELYDQWTQRNEYFVIGLHGSPFCDQFGNATDTNSSTNGIDGTYQDAMISTLCAPSFLLAEVLVATPEAYLP